jgi:hypothetical protein
LHPLECIGRSFGFSAFTNHRMVQIHRLEFVLAKTPPNEPVTRVGGGLATHTIEEMKLFEHLMALSLLGLL